MALRHDPEGCRRKVSSSHTRAFRVYALVWFVAGVVLAVQAVPFLPRIDAAAYSFFVPLSAAGNLIAIQLPFGVAYTMQGAVALAGAWLYGWPILVPINLISTVILVLTLRGTPTRGALYFGNATVSMTLAALLFDALTPESVPVAPSWSDVGALLVAGLLFSGLASMVVAVGRYLDTGDRSHVSRQRLAYLTAFAFASYVPASYMMATAYVAGRGGAALAVAVWYLNSLAIKGYVETREANARLAEAMERLRELSVTDPLTGAYNRRHFDERLREELQRARRQDAPVSLLILDLRNFKQVNDTFGHQAGDDVLCRTVQAIRSHVRSTDFVFRIGGDEFAVLLPGTDAAGALRVARTLIQAVSEVPVIRDDVWIVPEVTVGVATYPDHGETAAQLVLAADAAMYRAREMGSALRAAEHSSASARPTG